MTLQTGFGGLRACCLAAGLVALLALDCSASAAPVANATAAPGTAAVVAKKRAPAPEVEAVTIDGVRFEALAHGKALGLGQNGGLLAAIDSATGKTLWTLRVYDVHYLPTMEADKQDILISSLRAVDQGHGLHVTDERGRRWRVDLRTRSVSREKP